MAGTAVTLEASPEVQLLGDAAVIRGAAALDAYRVLTEGVAAVRRRDGIEPSLRLLRTVAALKAAAFAGRRAADIADTTDVRGAALPASLRSGELIGVSEVANMCGIGIRQARRLAPSLGGHKKRSGEWVFDRGLVSAYLNDRRPIR